MPHTNHFAWTKSNVFFLLLGPVVLWISAIPSALATPSPSQMRVGVCQLATNPGRQHLDQNLAEISLCLFYQYLAGTQLTVVPEVSDMGFMPHALDPRGYDGDKPIPGLYTDLLGSLARTYQMWIVMGLTEREQYGYRSNTIVAIDHNGDLVKMSRKFRNSIAQGDNYTGTDPFTRTYPVLQGSFQDVSAIDSPWGPLVVGICADMPKDSQRRILVETNARLGLFSFANPQARLMRYAGLFAQECNCPAVTVNTAFPPDPVYGQPQWSGGGSVYYDAQGQPLVTLPAAGPAIWTRDINLPPIRNARPLSHAGEPAVLYGSTAILDLDGFAIDDGLGPQPLSISWSMEQGPGPVAFDNANAAQTRAHFSQPGTYKLRLRASDGEFATDSFLYATQHTASGAADPSLVLALDFEGNLLDSSGYGNHASAHGDVLRYVRTRATGPQGGSHGVYFNGNSYLTVAHDNSLNITEGTIAFWLQMDHIPALNPGGELLHLLAKSEPGEYTSGNYSLEWNFLGNFVFSFLDQVWDTQGPFLDAWRYARPTPSSPVHVAISFTPNWVKTYLGGRLDHTSKVRAETKFNTAPLYIGSKGPGNGIALTGFIDELRIWNRVLASDEIATHVGISDTNDVPTADAGPNLVVRVNEWTALRGRCLDDTDPGNYPYEYAITRAAEFKEWRKVSGPSYVRIRDRYSKGSAQPASALFDTAGEYQMLLTCFGGSGVDYDAITVTVTP